jgi:hypothetical protein
MAIPRRLVTTVIAAATFMFQYNGVPAQESKSIFRTLIGTWRNTSTQRTIRIDEYGRVWTYNGGLSGRVSEATVGGSNFAFSSEEMECNYDIAIYTGRLRTGWALKNGADRRSASCPQSGEYAREDDGDPPIAPERKTHFDEAEKAWSEGVKDSKSTKVLLDFFGRYGDTIFGTLAKERIEELSKTPAKIENANADPSPRPTLVDNSDWNHNGSTMSLRLSGSEIKFYYRQPRPGMIAEGVRSGTLLFSGRRSGDQVSGTAYVFNRHCDEGFPYRVNGEILNNMRQIIVRGYLTRIDFSQCQDTGAGSHLDTLVFDRMN